MFKKLKGKGRLSVIGATLAFVVASFGIAMPQQASAFKLCSPSPHNFCASTIDTCLKTKPLLVMGTSNWQCTGAVQGFMKEVYGMNLTTDGLYGTQTAFVVAWFQGQFHITVDGKVGSQTWGKIKDVCAIVSTESNPVCSSSYPVYF